MQLTGRPLKFKDMVEVKFTLLDKSDADNDGQKLIAKEERYKVKMRRSCCIDIGRGNSNYIITRSESSLQIV